MPNLSRVLKQLQIHRKRVEQELARLDAAISALRGTSNGLGRIRFSEQMEMDGAPSQQLNAGSFKKLKTT